MPAARTRTLRTLWLWPLLALLTVVAACATGDGGSTATRAAPSATTVAAVVATPTSDSRVVFPVTVRGSENTSVTLSARAERIVCLSPGATESFFAIGAGDQMVGVDRFSNYPAATARLPKIDYSTPNIEAIVALRPDLVVVSDRQRALVAVLQGAGINVLFLEEPVSVAGVLERIRLQGQVSDHAREADELVRSMQARIASITQKVQGAPGPRVYHELDPKLFTAAPGSFVGDLYTLLGARNIAPAGSSKFPQITAESIIAADPEVIVSTAAEFPGGSPADIQKRPGWAGIRAVQTDRIYPLSGDLLSRPGPRLVDGLESLARALYPDRFP